MDREKTGTMSIVQCDQQHPLFSSTPKDPFASHPFWSAPPAFGIPVPVAPGILFLRMPLPFRLDHINLYLFEDDGGWTLFDTGIGDTVSKELWQIVLDRHLGGKPIVRIIASHFHPDHVGLVGWFTAQFGMPLLMSQAEYLVTRLLHLPEGEEDHRRAFYHRAGLAATIEASLMARADRYLHRTTGVPTTYRRLADGDVIAIGGRSWQVMTGEGHAPEQVMLWCASDRLFLSADQILPKISPNVSVIPMEPTGDPLGLFLDSLHAVARTVSDDVLVLPCHGLPFRGLHNRIAALSRHHDERCALLVAACSKEAQTCAALMGILFKGIEDPHQMGFALGETYAHLNRLCESGALVAEPGPDDVLHYRLI